MDTGALRAFAREARRRLKEQVGAKLALVLAPEAQARREAAPAVAALEAQIGEQGEAQVIERVAYLWFNRLSALRFMDAERALVAAHRVPCTGRHPARIAGRGAGGASA